MILDTNAVSAIVEDDRSIGALLAGTSTPAIPVIVIGEYRYGLRLSSRRTETARAFEALLAAARVLTIDAETADHYAAIRHGLRQAGRPIPENDLWIAATALRHALPIASRDTHFDAVPGVVRHGW